MRIELEAEGVPVQFIAINADNAESTQDKLVAKCSFPLLQDQPDIVVWDLMMGKKDDFYIYDANGNLADFLPVSGDISVNLSTEEGYDNLKDAILAVAAP